MNPHLEETRKSNRMLVKHLSNNKADAGKPSLRNLAAVVGVVSVGTIAGGATAAAKHSDILSDLIFYGTAGAYGVGGAIVGAGIGLTISTVMGVAADVLNPYVGPLLGHRRSSDLGEDIQFAGAGMVLGGSIGAATGMALEQCGESLYWLVSKL